ncbi:GNAT family N-acetyltransferase [Pseudooceanicola sp.]|uniref:GNAT family N-acetyltransferase n=1 Tax=Pseudooceanicola sp. TaxID=1914328 RepID=UPI002613CF48|nr:GNAT family N-acetyltransferase [Pseudooceanicola sp.]MDF1854667.1 GNAT family N-acetyltransferase [Pseudooceanicola sp.]
MTAAAVNPVDLAALHARAFTTPRPWGAEEFTALLASPGVFCLTAPATATAGLGALLLGRVVADEVELLTLATAPEARRCGHGRALLAGFEAAAAGRGAGSAFLEVAADNAAALALYQSAGWIEAARRPGYFRAPDGHRSDAVILRKSLV